jgi:hypothetical protein
MATLILKGPVAKVVLDKDLIDGMVWATCVKHAGVKRPDIDRYRTGDAGCIWIHEYDDLNDAVEYAADHADTGRQS